MIAVMGAAGNVGGKVADLLLRGGERIRVLQHVRRLDELRDRGVDVVAGEAAEADDLRPLFDGADAALVLLPEDVAQPRFVATRSRIAAAVAQALREARVPHVVALSAVGADRDDAPGPQRGLHEFERRLSELADGNVLVLRSAAYMDYLLASLPLIRSQRINGSAVNGDLRFPMVATRDVAQEAAERLARRDFAGHQVKLLLGPEDVSLRQATGAIGALLGIADLPYVELPPAEMRRALAGAGMSEEAASVMVDMQLALNDGRYFNGVRRTPATTTPTRLEEFLKEALAR
jgi:uncharacterized protein YbjT (DUF2867 family)